MYSTVRECFPVYDEALTWVGWKFTTIEATNPRNIIKTVRLFSFFLTSGFLNFASALTKIVSTFFILKNLTPIITLC